jgi:hypothetical protein
MLGRAVITSQTFIGHGIIQGGRTNTVVLD